MYCSNSRIHHRLIVQPQRSLQARFTIALASISARLEASHHFSQYTVHIPTIAMTAVRLFARITSTWGLPRTYFFQLACTYEPCSDDPSSAWRSSSTLAVTIRPRPGDQSFSPARRNRFHDCLVEGSLFDVTCRLQSTRAGWWIHSCVGR